MNDLTVVWRRLDEPGFEHARLSSDGEERRLTGAVVLVDGGVPCRLEYEVACDARWETRSGRVAGRIGDREIDVEFRADASHRWWVNGREHPELADCVDVDLSFTPSTNLLPIRRLDLVVGAQAEVRAAWLVFPEMAFQVLSQVYRRREASRYRYESGGGSFAAELEVDPKSGFVVRYATLWELVAGPRPAS
jgi:hypothetical protein